MNLNLIYMQPSTNVSVNSTTSTVHPLTHCLNKTREFANMRGCSAGLNLRPQSSQVFFPQPMSSCERQLFFSRFCPSQKCLNSYVDLLEECLTASGLENIIQNLTAVISSISLLQWCNVQNLYDEHVSLAYVKYAYTLIQCWIDLMTFGFIG